MQPKLNISKKTKKTKSVKDSSHRKQGEQERIGSFTENLSYIDDVPNALSTQARPKDLGQDTVNKKASSKNGLAKRNGSPLKQEAIRNM